jgi:hypothetical protein
VLLGPASASVITVVGANGSLTSDTFIARKALAGANLAIAEASVRAFSPRVEIVSINNSSNPGEILGASS